MADEQRTAAVEYRDRINAALGWIARHRSKWDGLTIELSCIEDCLTGRCVVDGTSGAMEGEPITDYLAELRSSDG
jgi:hypothetical protein